MRYRVYVYRYEYPRPGSKNGYTVTYLTADGATTATPPCVHDVDTTTSNQAQHIAAREHRDFCGNRVT